jgi:type I restriction enzyme S subunit
MSFRKVELSDCGTWLSGGTPTKSNDDYWGGEIPWISAKSLHDFYIRDSDDRVTEVGARNGTKKVDAGTVLILVRGMSLTEEIRVGVTKRPVVFNQDVKAIQPAEGVDALFLANAIRASEPRLLSLVDEASHGTGRLQTSTLEQFQIPLPQLPIQRRIADILGALDDKIELNRRMNRTLEEMAQTLYRHWFVDFGPFQDRAFKDTEERGAIPEGWELKPVYDLCDVLTGGTPKTKVDKYWGGDIRWVSAKDISNHGTIVLDTERKVTPVGVEESTTDVLPDKTVVVVARGSVGKHCIIGRDMAMNQSCYGLRGREGIGQSWTYLMLNDLIQRLQQVAYGSVFDTITISTFKNTEIPAPPVELIQKFEEKVDPLFDLMHSNAKENQTLAETRDYLLPKLISGEIEVDAAEEAVEQTTDETVGTTL